MKNYEAYTVLIEHIRFQNKRNWYNESVIFKEDFKSLPFSDKYYKKCERQRALVSEGVKL